MPPHMPARRHQPPLPPPAPALLPLYAAMRRRLCEHSPRCRRHFHCAAAATPMPPLRYSHCCHASHYVAAAFTPCHAAACACRLHAMIQRRQRRRRAPLAAATSAAEQMPPRRQPPPRRRFRHAYDAPPLLMIAAEIDVDALIRAAARLLRRRASCATPHAAYAAAMPPMPRCHPLCHFALAPRRFSPRVAASALPLPPAPLRDAQMLRRHAADC